MLVGGSQYPVLAMSPTSQQERQKQRRAERLEDMREQVEKGTLVIRKMTAEERELNPPARKRPIGLKRRS
jgi:hypothetical protein